MAQSRCAEVTSTAQQGRPTICVQVFLVFLSAELLCPWQMFSFRAVLELVCTASGGEGGEMPANPPQAGLVLVGPEHTRLGVSSQGDPWAQRCPEVAVGNPVPKILCPNH